MRLGLPSRAEAEAGRGGKELACTSLISSRSHRAPLLPSRATMADASRPKGKHGPKTGITEEGGRRHREAHAVQIRKSGREEQLLKRRQVRR